MPKKVKVELDYDHEQIVYLKTDPDQLPRMVVEIKLLPNAVALYGLACGAEDITEHYACELTAEAGYVPKEG